jgi:uncharacterized protein (TIGR02147 family)
VAELRSGGTEPGYRHLLADELLARVRRNSAYSARALARDIRVSPGFLSLVMAGRKRLTEERAHQIAERLGWSARRSGEFVTLVRHSRARDERVRARILSELKTAPAMRELGDDVFRAISGWYHYAILELGEVEGFVADPRWLARRLGLPVRDVRAAIARLARLGLLDARTLRKTTSNYSIRDVPSRAIRDFHRQMLARARRALARQSMEERDFSGVTMAIDPERLGEARARIREFRRELMEYLEAGPRRRAVYQLSVQLFRLDEEKT